MKPLLNGTLNRALLILAIGVLTITVIVYHFLIESRESSNSVGSEAPQEMSSIPDGTSERTDRRKQLFDQLKKANALGKQLAREKHIAGGPMDDDTLNVSPLTPEELAIIEEIDRRHFYQARVGLRRIHESESPNDKWTARVENYASEMIASGKFQGTALGEVDCRKTLCRLTLRHDGEESMKNFMQNGTSEGPWQEGGQHGFTNKMENGAVESTVYFSDEESGATPFNEVRQSIIEEVEKEKGVDAKIGS